MNDDRDPIPFRSGLPTPSARDFIAAVAVAVILLPVAWLVFVAVLL